MAATGVSFAISLGLNLLTLLLLYAAFAILREAASTRKFYAPRRAARDANARPARLPTGWFAWLGAVHNVGREAVLACAGADALLYLEVLNLYKELFIFASFWSLATVLPVNLVGRQVAALRAASAFVPNEFTYWVAPGAPPPPPPSLCREGSEFPQF
jgi:hypothetical protein